MKEKLAKAICQEEISDTDECDQECPNGGICQFCYDVADKNLAIIREGVKGIDLPFHPLDDYREYKGAKFVIARVLELLKGD